MKWNDIKNILIILLAAVNVFLLCNMALWSIKANALPDGIAESVVNILAQSGITIDKRLIPSRYERRSVIEVEYYRIDYLSEMLLKERVQYKSDGANVVAERDGARITLSSNWFSYETGLEKAEKNGKKIMSALKRLGFDTVGAFYDEKDGLVKMKIDNAVVIGFELDVSLSKDGTAAAIKGRWGKIKSVGKKERISVISVLPQITAEMPSGTHINEIKKVYIIAENGKNYSAKAGWSLTADGEVYTVG